MTSQTEELPLASFILLALYTLAAFVSNAFIIFVIATAKQMRTGSRTVIFIVGNLAVSDLIFCGMAIPLTLASTTIKLDWSLGNAGCKLIMFLPNFCVAVSIFTLCIIARDRRIVIKGGSSSERKKPKVILVTTGIWIAGFIVAAPALYEYSVYTKVVTAGASIPSSSEEVDESDHDVVNATYYRACGSHNIVESFEKIYATILTLVIYVIPLVYITCNYTMILVHVIKKERQLKRNMSENLPKRPVMTSNTSRVLKMMFAIITIFAVCWAPYFFLFFREEVTGSDDTSNFGSLLHTIKLYMSVTSSILNPLVYGLFNSHIRRGFYAMFCCSNKVHPQTSVGPSVVT